MACPSTPPVCNLGALFVPYFILSLSFYVTLLILPGNEFVRIGDSAIVSLGTTRYMNATDGNQPRYNLVANNFIHEIGLWVGARKKRKKKEEQEEDEKEKERDGREEQEPT